MIKSIMLTCGLAFALAAALAAVKTSGKQPVALTSVPPDVLQRIGELRAGFRATTAEYEVRNGRVYYDIEGADPDGSEIEFDVTEVSGRWTVVEIQRDIEPAAAPAAVRERLAAAYPAFSPRRVIESDQGDGVIIFEYFGPSGDRPETKIEIRYEAGEAELLTEEWVH